MFRAIAISLSLLAAVALAFGAQFQNDSVTKNSDKKAGEKSGVGSVTCSNSSATSAGSPECLFFRPEPCCRFPL
ncbi:MAG: hypothetical protein RLY22_214 [Actinomycetota bacterium]